MNNSKKDFEEEIAKLIYFNGDRKAYIFNKIYELNNLVTEKCTKLENLLDLPLIEIMSRGAELEASLIFLKDVNKLFFEISNGICSCLDEVNEVNNEE